MERNKGGHTKVKMEGRPYQSFNFKTDITGWKDRAAKLQILDQGPREVVESWTTGGNGA